MRKYLLQRCVRTLIVLLGLSLASFVIVHLTPGGPCAGFDGTAFSSAANHEECVARLGLNRPLVWQYARQMDTYLHGDLGRSISGDPVRPTIVHKLPATILLMGSAYLLQQVLALALGIMAAAKPYRFPDRMLRAITFVGFSIPAFWLGLMLIYFLGVRSNLLPAGGMGSVTVPAFWSPAWHVMLRHDPRLLLGDLARHLILPVVVLAFTGALSDSRLVRNSLIDTMRRNYMRTARAAGLSGPTVLVRHARRNIVLPLIGNAGASFPIFLGATVVTEALFGWSGVGAYYVTAVRSADFPVIVGITEVVAVVMVLAVLSTDLVYAWLDPRTRPDRAGVGRGSIDGGLSAYAVAGSIRSLPQAPTWSVSSAFAHNGTSASSRKGIEQSVGRRFRAHRLARAGGLVLVPLSAVALFAPLISPENYRTWNDLASNLPPRLTYPGASDWRYLLGTDSGGHSILMWVTYGARVSLGVGVVAAVVSAIIALVVGTASGYAGGRLDAVVSYVTEVVLAVPLLLLLVLLNAYLGHGRVWSLALILGGITWPMATRLVRDRVRVLRTQETLDWARAVGVSETRVIVQYILPGVIPPLIVTTVFSAAGIVALEAAIDFLGVGLARPSVSWGLALANSQDYFGQGNWWWAFFPGVFLCAAAVALACVGSGLQASLPLGIEDNPGIDRNRGPDSI